MTKQFIIVLAVNTGWSFPLEEQPNALMISFFKGDMRVNVYYTTMTVSTAIDHPVKGRCQMYRRNVTQRQLASIFQNPRVHLGKGYHHKSKLRPEAADAMGDQFDALQLP